MCRVYAFGAFKRWSCVCREAVLSVAEVADEGAQIGYEILGDEEFER